MKTPHIKPATRTGLALAAASALVALALPGPAAADPVTSPTFLSAGLSIETRGEAAGSLVCSWREAGLAESQVVYYTCGAGAVGALKACVYKNRVIYASPTRLDVFRDVIGGEHGGAEPFLAQKNGLIHASTVTPIPHLETGTELCLAPSEEVVVAVRWCNASLADMTNALPGATFSELYQEFFSSVGSVPPCSELLVTP